MSGHTEPTTTVVVTDIGSPADVQRCLQQVTRTVPRDVEVVVLTAGRERLPAQLAKRVRRVRVAAVDELSAAVERELARPRTVVVLRSTVRVDAGWLGQVTAAADHLGDTLGVLGSSIAHVVLSPAYVTRTDLAPVLLTGVDKVREPGAVAASVAATASLSAVLIVKDEEDVLADCLASVTPFVDEVVVYDTGSTDGTRAVAAAAGARVVEGYWDDDFGAARNRALADATTDWVLSLDADETLTGDPASLRQRLSREAADVLFVPLVNATWSGAEDGDEVRPERLFRRDRAAWDGALHERLVPTGSGLRGSLEPAPVRLVHTGYQAERVEAKDKVERNVSLAKAALDRLDPAERHDPLAWCNYGRSLAMAHRYDEALDALAVVRDNPTHQPSVVLAARTAVETCLVTDRVDEAEPWIVLAEEHGEAPGQAVVWRAHLALLAGDLTEAGRLLAQDIGGTDTWGVPFGPERAVLLRARLLRESGRPADALDALVDACRTHPELVPVADLRAAMLAAGRTPADVVGRLPEAVVARSLRETMRLGPDVASEWCTALWTLRQDPRAIVVGCVAASRLTIESAIAWSLRARENGLVDHCPLRVVADDPDRLPLDRAVATAILAEVLLEPAAAAVLESRLAEVPLTRRHELARSLRDYAPGALRATPGLAGLAV
jgi:hypothetical protein